MCENCNKGLTSTSTSKPTIRIKSAASRSKERKLAELGAIVRGTSSGACLWTNPQLQTNGASSSSSRIQGPIEKASKLRELGKIIRGEAYLTVVPGPIIGSMTI
jgi:hypothetical protein